MLEFTEVFLKRHDMSNHKEIVMKCKNIDFGYAKWKKLDRDFYDNRSYMVHIIDNIIDVSAYDNNNPGLYTFFEKIIYYSTDSHIIHYMFNNGCINNKSFTPCFTSSLGHHVFCKCCPRKHFDKLTYYLTAVSLNKFKGYYNLEKYYYMINIMLLIIKAQKNLPSVIIKHLIIPFIYQ